MTQEVLDSLQNLPEVIKPEHIRVNIGKEREGGSHLRQAKDKDNLYHRNIVKKAI